MKKYGYILLLLFLAFDVSVAVAQKSKIDSFKVILIQCKEDTSKIKILNLLASQLSLTNPDTAIILSDQALALSEKIMRSATVTSSLKNILEKHMAVSLQQLGRFNYLNGDYAAALKYDHESLIIWEKLSIGKDLSLAKSAKNGMAKTLGNIGSIYLDQSDFPKALDFYFKALKMVNEIGDKGKIAIWLGNIGNVYSMEGDYSKALDYYFRALKTDEELNDKGSIAADLCNIGNVYYTQSDYPKALDNYLRSLKLTEENGDKKGVASILGNIGMVYSELGNFSKALDHYLKSLKMTEEFGDKKGVEITQGNIGNVFSTLGDFPKALDYYFKALKMAEEIGDQSSIATWLNSIGNVYTKTGKFKDAQMFLNRSLELSLQIGAVDVSKVNEKLLSDLYDVTGRHALALEHYKKYIAYRDTINSEESQKKQVKSEMNYEFEKREAVMKEAQGKERAVAEEKNRFQRVIIYTVVMGLIIVIGFAIFVFRSLKTTKKQKLIIEEKQMEILDSIHYAKRIQTALMTNEKYIQKILSKLQSEKK